MEQSWCFRGERFSFRGPHLIASATVSEGADRPERSAGKKTFDNRILILRRFKRRFGSESNPSAKVLLFFDMAMGWSGLRAVLVRILCICLLFSDKYGIFKKQRRNEFLKTRSNRNNIFNLCILCKGYGYSSGYSLFFLFSTEAIYIGVYYI